MDYLLLFESPLDFKTWMKEYNIANNWNIEHGLMNNRGKAIVDSSYYLKLSQIFNAKKMFRRKVSVAEVVTWLDSFVHIERIINDINEKIDNNSYNYEIIFEYVIEMSKKSRVDCIFRNKKTNAMCLVEFTTVDSFEKLSNKYKSKRLELMIYKDLMMNYISDRIVVFPFVGIFEWKYKKLVKKNYDYNIAQSKFASEYIYKYVIK